MAYKPKVLAVGEGGTGLTTLTAHSIQLGNGTSTPTQLSVGASSTVLQGSTGADPSFTATPTVTSITFGAGTALSSYVEGTFTPALSFGGGTTGITYSSQTGKYTRIGNIVHISLTIGISSKGSSTGAAKITGLPVTVNGAGQILFFQSDGITYPVGYLAILMNPDNGATTGTLYATATATVGNLSGLADTNFANSTTIRLEGFYFA